VKKIPVILNVVLAIAVIVLYILFFTSGKNAASSSTASQGDTGKVTLTGGGIVYINIDSVLNGYDMYYDIQADLQEKLKTSEAQLKTKEKSLREEMQDFQYKIDRGLVTRAEAGQLQQELAQKEQNLYQLQNSLQMQLAEEEQVAQRKVLNSIMEYLEELEKSGEYDYRFVLGTTFGGNILYANESLNITREVIKGLNANYTKE
jgi:outer membrane protein